MPRKSPFVVVLTPDEHAELEARVRRYTSPYCDVIRAKIVLLAAEGLPNDAIAARVDLPRQVVSKWRQRFYRQRLGGLEAEPRGGRPARFSPSVVVEVKRIACEAPADLGLPLSRLTIPEVRRLAVARGLVAAISGTTVWRWLAADAIKPWRYRSWIFPRDPAFAERAGRVLDLYAGTWEGVPLGPDDFVISADEKTSIQARRRCHETITPRPGAPGRVEHEYVRCGAWAYFAAWDVRRAKLFGRCEAHTGKAPFDRLVAQVMEQEPYLSARRVFWILDNGSSHQGKLGTERLQSRWSNLIVVHTPVHASWLNQIEIYFSIVERKALTPNDFKGLADVEARLLAFQARYETIAKPFKWTFTRQDLLKVLARVALKKEAERPAA